MIFTLLLANSLFAGEFIDDFSKKELEGRLLQRGDWKLENNQIVCKSDPELYKKYKNHGPIIKWQSAFKDIDVEFEMKAVDCTRVVLTLNGKGHIFRVTLAEHLKQDKKKKIYVTNRIIAWAEQSSKENKGETIQPKGLPTIKDVNGTWIKFRLSVKGDTCDLQIGDFKTQVKHAALKRDKNLVQLTFAMGELSLRNYKQLTR